MGKRKKDGTFLRKKTDEKQNTVTKNKILLPMTSVNGKETVFPMKFKLQGESFEKTY